MRESITYINEGRAMTDKPIMRGQENHGYIMAVASGDIDKANQAAVGAKPDNPPICANCKHFTSRGVTCRNPAAMLFSPVCGFVPRFAGDARGVASYSKCGPDGVLFEQRDDSARELRFVWRWLWKFICLFRRKA
jgi:hypothetical protein